MKRILFPVLISILLTGCSTIMQKPEKDHVASSILENNKQELTTIKNKTADDLELGFKVRALVKKQLTDEEFGIKVRELIAKQEGVTSTTIDIRNKTSEINNRLNTLILIVVVLIFVSLMGHYLIELKGRRNERMVSKRFSRMGDQDSDN